MVIKRESKKDSKIKEYPLKEKTTKITKEETVFARVGREMREQKQKELEEKKQKEIDDAKEKNRVDKVITNYLTKLDEQLKEKSDYFWVFPKKSGFKKLVMSDNEMKKFVKQDVEKYANKTVAYFSIHLYHDDEPDSTFRKYDIWMLVSIQIYKMNSKCKMDNISGCHFIWHPDDFRTTKFSYKLLETIMRPINDGKKSCVSLTGIPVTVVIKDLQKKGIDFDDVLKPLAKL